MDALTLVEDGTPLWRDDGAFSPQHWNFHLGIVHLEDDVMLGVV
jgi:hypothetical protein